MGSGCCRNTVIAVCIALFLIASVILISISLQKLDSYEVGISYDNVWKKLGKTPKHEGLYPGPPGFEFIKFPSVFRTIDFGEVTCLNLDGVPVYLNVAFQYQARAENLRSIILEFKDHETYQKVIKTTAISVILETCSLYNTQQFQEHRIKIQGSLKDNLRKRYNQLRCDITDLQVKNIRRPGKYEQAIRAKENARENIKVANHERPIRVTKANTKLREAETQANITIDKALSQSRITLNRAALDAQAVLVQYEHELRVYRSLVLDVADGGLGLSPEAFLSYMATRVLAGSSKPVYFGMKAPAQASYFP